MGLGALGLGALGLGVLGWVPWAGCLGLRRCLGLGGAESTVRRLFREHGAAFIVVFGSINATVIASLYALVRLYGHA